MDIIDDIIDLFYRHSSVRITEDGECEVFLDDERNLKEGNEKILKEK